MCPPLSTKARRQASSGVGGRCVPAFLEPFQVLPALRLWHCRLQRHEHLGAGHPHGEERTGLPAKSVAVPDQAAHELERVRLSNRLLRGFPPRLHPGNPGVRDPALDAQWPRLDALLHRPLVRGYNSAHDRLRGYGCLLSFWQVSLDLRSSHSLVLPGQRPLQHWS